MIRRNQFELTDRERSLQPAHPFGTSVIKPQGGTRILEAGCATRCFRPRRVSRVQLNPPRGKDDKIRTRETTTTTDDLLFALLTTAQTRRRRPPPSLVSRTFRTFVPLLTFANRLRPCGGGGGGGGRGRLCAPKWLCLHMKKRASEAHLLPPCRVTTCRKLLRWRPN